MNRSRFNRLIGVALAAMGLSLATAATPASARQNPAAYTDIDAQIKAYDYTAGKKDIRHLPAKETTGTYARLRTTWTELFTKFRAKFGGTVNKKIEAMKAVASRTWARHAGTRARLAFMTTTPASALR